MTARTNVLIVSATLGGGGAERFTSTLLQHLDRTRFQPRLCVLRGPITYALPSDVQISVLGKTRPRHIPRVIWRLRRLIRDTRPDVVVGNMLYTNWLLGAAMAGSRTRPYWVARHAAPPTVFESSADRLLAPFVRHLLGRASAHVANSKALAAAVRTWLPAASGPVTAIYNPVDFEYIERQAQVPLDPVRRSEPPVLLWAGRLESQKRPDVLLRAFARVRTRTDATLWILGEGTLRPQMEAFARQLGIAGHVVFLGFDPNPYRWMRHADIFVLTSDFEGLPNALLEAQALGLPAVSSRCPTGPEEIIEEGVTGYLTPIDDPKAIAARIVDLCSDSDRRRVMGRAGQVRLGEMCALTPVIQQWESVILQLAVEENRPRLDTGK